MNDERRTMKKKGDRRRGAKNEERRTMNEDRSPRRPGLARSIVQGTSRWQVLLLPAAAILMFWNVLTGKRYFWEDIVQQFYPSLSFLANSLHHLQIPYWSPYVFSGIPFIGDIQTQVFYPPNWLLTFFVNANGRLSFLALEVLIIAHVVTAGFLMYWLAREWRLPQPSALFAALCFMCSGFVILRTIHLGVIYTYTWFPLLVLLFHRSVHERKLIFALGAGLVFGLAALGGYPQTLMHMGYFLGLYALFLIASNWRTERGETIGRCAAGLGLVVVVGIGIAAAQYLPSIEYVKYTVRVSLDYASLVEASLKPPQLLTLLAPKFFGSVAGGSTDTVLFWIGKFDFEYWETVIYIGVLPLMLALFALSDRKQPRRWFLLAAGAIALILALGRYTPVYRVALAVLPGFRRFRIPGRLSDIFTFCMAILAGFGADLFLRKDTERSVSRLLRIAAISSGIAIVVLILLNLVPGLRSAFPETKDAANATGQWALFTMLLLLATGIVFLRFRRVLAPSAGFWLLVLLTFADLFSFGRKFNAMKDKPYPQQTVIERLQEEQDAHRLDPFRINSRIPGVAMLFERNTGNVERLELLEGYTPLGIARYAPFVVPTPRMLDLLNARYVAGIDSSSGKKQYVLKVNSNALPRARMVYRYRVMASDSAALWMVRDSEFDYRNVAILEQDPGFPSRADDSVNNEVEFTQREANRMKLQVRTDEPGILALSEVYYPEWKATIDGKPADIYPQDFALRGVTIPAGTHQVELWFDGSRVKLGMLISLLTLIITAGLIVWLRRRRPVSGSAPAVTPEEKR
jgi:hypothetical protein